MTDERHLPRLLVYCPVWVTAGASPASPRGTGAFATHVLGLSEDRSVLVLELPPAAARLWPDAPVRLALDDGAGLWSFATRVVEVGAADFRVARPLLPSAYERLGGRRILRVPMTCRAMVSLCQDGRSRPVPGETRNLGGGGCALRTRAPLPAGAEVRVRIRLPAGTVLACAARVVESVALERGGHESRLRFEDLDEDAQSALLRECYRVQRERRAGRLSL